jgi:hypothetical protein
VRSARRDAAIERFTVDHGRKPTNNEVAVLVRESRADKLAEISTEKLRKQQQARLLPEESHALNHLHEESVDRTGEISIEPTQASESLQRTKEHLFERSSVVREHELMTEALRHGRGKIDRLQLRGALELEQLQGSLIRAGNNLATRESLEREQRMIAAVDSGIGRYNVWAGSPDSIHQSDCERNNCGLFIRYWIRRILPSICAEPLGPAKPLRSRKLLVAYARWPRSFGSCANARRS